MPLKLLIIIYYDYCGTQTQLDAALFIAQCAVYNAKCALHSVHCTT